MPGVFIVTGVLTCKLRQLTKSKLQQKITCISTWSVCFCNFILVISDLTEKSREKCTSIYPLSQSPQFNILLPLLYHFLSVLFHFVNYLHTFLYPSILVFPKNTLLASIVSNELVIIQMNVPLGVVLAAFKILNWFSAIWLWCI